jgi:hypothetical protein
MHHSGHSFNRLHDFFKVMWLSWKTSCHFIVNKSCYKHTKCFCTWTCLSFQVFGAFVFSCDNYADIFCNIHYHDAELGYVEESQVRLHIF